MDPKSNYIPFIAQKIRMAKKKLVDVVAPPKDPNKFKVDVDPLKRPKLTPEELAADMKANRGTGYHKNPAEKRKNNPNRQDWD